MSKCFVRFCHSVRCFFLGDSNTFTFVSGANFCKKALVHRLPFCAFRRLYYPTEAEREFTLWPNLARHLVVGATDTE